MAVIVIYTCTGTDPPQSRVEWNKVKQSDIIPENKQMNERR